MFETITTWLVSVVAFVSAPFIAPPVAQNVETIPEPVIEQVVVQEEVVVPVVQEIDKPVEVDESAIPDPTPTATVSEYCTKYASKFSTDAYKKEKAKPVNIEKTCEKENADRNSNGNDFSMNCESMAKKHYKVFEDWEEQFDAYHAKCN